MKLTFEDLATILPPGSVEFVGNNQMKINFSLISGQKLTLQSSVIEGITKFLQGLTDLTSAINADRHALNPPKAPITFATHSFDGDPQNPELVYEIRAAVNPSSFVENLFDPTSDS